MSRWMIGLLIFPLAEHKSLFYPPSLNLSRVKCLCSQLLAVLRVCLSLLCILFVSWAKQSFNLQETSKMAKTKRQLKNSLVFPVMRTGVCVGACLPIAHAQTLSSLQMEMLKQTVSEKTYRRSREVTQSKRNAAHMCVDGSVWLFVSVLGELGWDEVTVWASWPWVLYSTPWRWWWLILHDLLPSCSLLRSFR